MTEYYSAFKERIAGFFDFRVARGFKRKPYLIDLAKFDRWCLEECPNLSSLSRELVHAWISEESRSETARRATVMRRFGKYLAAIGENAYVLPEKYAPLRSPAVPYLFTDAELSALFSAIDALPATSREPFFHEMAPALFRLIYTCGLRPNEGREVLRENVRGRIHRKIPFWAISSAESCAKSDFRRKPLFACQLEKRLVPDFCEIVEIRNFSWMNRCKSPLKV